MKQRDFVTADHHFGHRAIIRHSRRPFESLHEMDTELIKRWNAKVPVGAVVYHLGDFSWRNKARTEEILWQLNGRIRLCRGNHDQVIRGSLVDEFDWVRDYYESKTEDSIKVVMCHWAFRTWSKSHHGSWNLHGHSHGSLTDLGTRQLDVGVDAHPNHEPFAFWEIAALMAQRSHVPVDHRGAGP